MTTIQTSADALTAQELLAGAKSIAVVGERPLWERALGKTIMAGITGAKYVCYGLALNFALSATGIYDRLEKIDAPYGVIDEVAGLVSPQDKFTPGQINPTWINPPPNPILNHGLNPDGSLDHHRLTAAWLTAGATPDQIKDLVTVTNALKPVLMLRDDPSYLGMLQRDQEKILGRFAFLHPDLWDKLNTIDPQSIPANLSSMDLSASKTAQDIHWSLSGLTPSDLIHVENWRMEKGMPKPTVSSMGDAKDLLETAALDAGLASIELPWTAFTNPQSIAKHAQAITHANDELQRGTSLNGAVLGLDGRIHLILARPSNTVDGKVMLVNNNQLVMVSTYQALGHEWFHGLDYVMGREAFMRPTKDTAIGQAGAFRHAHHDHGLNDTLTLAKQNGLGAPSWHARMTQLDQERQVERDTDTIYFTDPTEALAFAAERQFDLSGASLIVRSRASIRDDQKDDYDFLYPSDQEAAAQAPIFQTFFTLAQSINLDGSKDLAPAPLTIKRIQGSRLDHLVPQSSTKPSQKIN